MMHLATQLARQPLAQSVEDSPARSCQYSISTPATSPTGPPACSRTVFCTARSTRWLGRQRRHGRQIFASSAYGNVANALANVAKASANEQSGLLIFPQDSPTARRETRPYLHMNSVVVFSLGKSSFRFLKLNCARTSLSMVMPSPMSITQLSRGSCPSHVSLGLLRSRRGHRDTRFCYMH